MKNRGGFIDRESMRQGARVGTEENVLSSSFSPSALTDCRKGKKKRLCTDYLTWCIIYTKIIVSDPGSHKCPVKLLPKICDNSFILFTLRPSKIGKTFREFPQVSLNSKIAFIFPV